MKLVEPELDFASNGVQGQFSYQIAQTTKMMEILSNFLYSDKPLACVREISINGLDAQISNGNADRPLEIFLPSTNNPEFRIRDFGEGMSPQFIETLYTTYGESTKSSDNSVTGFLGIGSKSIYCYATSFTTTSWYKGKKYVYINSKDKDNRPRLNRMMVVDAPNEESGVEVKWAVKAGDIHTFLEKAKAVYKYFSVKPIFTNNNISIEQDKFSIKEDDWGIFEQSYYGSTRSKVVSGHIAYHLDGSQFSGNIQQLINHGIVLFAPLGSVSVSASREELQYNSITKQYIEDKVNSIIKIMEQKAKDAIINASCLWDASITYYQFKRDYPLFSSLGIKPDWKGQQLYEYKYIDKTKLPDIEMRKITWQRASHATSVDLDKNVTFIWNDLKIGALARCRNSANHTTSYLLIYGDLKQKADFALYFGFPESYIKLASSLPKPPKQPRTVQKYDGYTFNPHSSSYRVTYYWQKAKDIDFAAGGYFVYVNGYYIKYEDGNQLSLSISPKNFSEILEIIPALKSNTIYGIQKKNLKKFKSSSKWIDVCELFKKHGEKLEKETSSTVSNLSIVPPILKQVSKYFTDNKSLSTTHPLIELEIELKSEMKYAANLELLNKLNNTMRFTFKPQKKSTIDLQGRVNIIQKKYPLLKHLETYNLRYEPILSYINALDTLNP